MTFNEWLADLLDPAHILTEGIYNIFFEIIATIIFVKLTLRKLIQRGVEKELERRESNLKE
jgi:hypothetical protein